jgi:hypothetical protein
MKFDTSVDGGIIKYVAHIILNRGGKHTLKYGESFSGVDFLLL